MSKSRFTEAQIIGYLKEAEKSPKVRELCREIGITEQTFYRWQGKFGGLEVSQAKRLREVEEENRRLLVTGSVVAKIGCWAEIAESTACLKS